MDQRVDVVTVGVHDIGASRRFYLDGLGWEAALDVPGEVLDSAVAAGATLVAPVTRRDWGGVSGYFADPDGVRWEVAHNPGLSVDADGRVSIGPVDS